MPRATRTFLGHDIIVKGNAGAPLSGPGVYVVGFDEYVKIGVSNCLYERILGLQETLPAELIVHAILEGGRKLERELHDRYQPYRLRGEWFRNEGTLKQWIEAKCIMPFFAMHVVSGGKRNDHSTNAGTTR